MAETNNDRVGRGLTLLAEGLAPFVDRAGLLRFGGGEVLWRAAALNSWVRRCHERVSSRSRANGPAALPRVPPAGPRDTRLQEI